MNAKLKSKKVLNDEENCPEINLGNRLVNASGDKYYEISEQHFYTLPLNKGDVWTLCNTDTKMSKERTILAKPTFLSPKSASLYGKLYPKSNFLKLNDSNNLNRELLLQNRNNFLNANVPSLSENSADETLSVISDDVFIKNGCNGVTSCSNTECLKGNCALHKQVPKYNTRTGVFDNALSKAKNNSTSYAGGSILKIKSTQTSPLLTFPFSHTRLEDQSILSNLKRSISRDSVDKLSEFSVSSYSSFSQDSILQEYHHAKTDIDLDPSASKQFAPYLKELNDLKNSLKLAEADTAILVSSKQQLQLENIDLNELSKSLNFEVDKLKQSLTEKDITIASLRRNHSSNEKRLKESFQEAEKNREQLKLRLDETLKKFDHVTVQNEQLTNKLSVGEQNYFEISERNKRLEDDVNQLLAKCVKLEFLANRAAEDSSDNSDYLNSIRTERDLFAKQLLGTEQEVLKKNQQISQLQEKLSKVYQEHSALVTTQANLTQSSKSKDLVIVNLQSQLALKEREKQALDGVVARLNDDLARVEISFAKIKKEIQLKTASSLHSSELKKDFETQIHSLKSDLEIVQKDSMTFSQKIHDKNNQISQLSSQLKGAFLAKRKCETEVSELKSQILSQHKALANSADLEKELKRVLEEKSHCVFDKDRLIDSLQIQLRESKARETEHMKKYEENSTQVVEKDKVLLQLQKDQSSLKQKLDECQTLLNEKETFLKQLNDQVELHERRNRTLNDELQQLQIKFAKRAVAIGQENGDGGMSDVIAQLQAARRELFESLAVVQQEKEKLKGENQSLRKENSELKAELSGMAKANETLQKSITALELDLIKKTKNLNELKDNEITLSEKISQLYETCNSLKKQTITNENLLKQAKSDLISKTEEIVRLSNSNKNLSEELSIAKSEMNSSNMRYAELLQSKADSDADKETAIMFERLQVTQKERDRLQDAVLQLQRYIDSLQAHYQQWITDASEKYNQLQSKMSTNKYDVSCQTNHEEKPLPSSMLLQSARSTSINSSTQTSHDDKPICSSPLKHFVFSDANLCENCDNNSSNARDKLMCTDQESLVLNKDLLETKSKTATCLNYLNSVDPTAPKASCTTNVPFRNEVYIGKFDNEYHPVKLNTSSQTDSSFCQLASSFTQTNVSRHFCFDVSTQTVSVLNSVSYLPTNTTSASVTAPTESIDVVHEVVETLKNTVVKLVDNKSFNINNSCTIPDSLHSKHFTTIGANQEKINLQSLNVSFHQTTPSLVSFPPDTKTTGSQTTGKVSFSKLVQTDQVIYRSICFNNDFSVQVELPTDFHSNKEKLIEPGKNFFSEKASADSICDLALPLPYKKVNSFTQTQSVNDDSSLPPFPNPRDLINNIKSEDRAKLKTYKQIVKVLKEKMKQAEKNIKNIQEECESLKLELKAAKLQTTQSILDKTLIGEDTLTQQSGRLAEELDCLKESNHQKEKLIESLQEELMSIKIRHDKEKSSIKSKAKINSILKDKKIKDVNERLKVLLEANERLRNTVSKLQVKLSASARDLTSCQREKLRYQYRARKLQADLRSLSWIATGPIDSSQSKASTTNSLQSKDGKFEKHSLELPSLVTEVDSMLKGLRKEIGCLEEQLTHHSSTVYQSQASIKELKNQSNETKQINNKLDATANTISSNIASSTIQDQYEVI